MAAKEPIAERLDGYGAPPIPVDSGS